MIFLKSFWHWNTSIPRVYPLGTYPWYSPDFASVEVSVKTFFNLTNHKKYERCAPLPWHRTARCYGVFTGTFDKVYVLQYPVTSLTQHTSCSELGIAAKGAKVQLFPHSVHWHLVTDPSLIIPRQWRDTCQSLHVAKRRGSSWILLTPCNVSTRMGSCPTRLLIWMLVGANPTPNYRETSHRATCSPPPLPAQEKHQSWR